MNDNLICLGGFGLIFLLVGIFVAWRAIIDWRKYRESESWLTGTAKITNTAITSHRGNKGGTSYQVHISYTYQVLGQSFQGNQLSFGSEGTHYGTRQEAEKIIAQYPEDNQASIYYDPNDPSQAVLERKYDSTSAILGIIFSVIGAGIFIYAYLQ